MGLFSNKSDIARSCVNGTVSTYYEFESVFKSNVDLEQKTNTSDDIFESVYINFKMAEKDEYKVAQSFMYNVSNLLSTMPTELLSETEKKEFNSFFTNSLRMSLRPMCPSPFYSSVPSLKRAVLLKPNILKEVGVLIIKRGSVDLLKSAKQRLNSSIERSASLIREAESGFFGEKCPDLWAQIIAIEYRCNSAAIWFNYLDKKER